MQFDTHNGLMCKDIQLMVKVKQFILQSQKSLFVPPLKDIFSMQIELRKEKKGGQINRKQHRHTC